MFQRFRIKRHPPRFQGRLTSTHHFEGWYYKIVDPDAANPFVIIPGVLIERQNDDSHAFIQCFDGRKNRTSYHRFPIENFKTRSDRFEIQIGKNRFTTDRMELDLNDGPLKVKGSLRFSGITP